MAVVPTADLVQSVEFTGNETSVIVVPPHAKTITFYVPTIAVGNLSVEGSLDGTSFVPLYGKSGSDDAPYIWASTTGNFISMLTPVLGLHSVKFKSSVALTGAEILYRVVLDKTSV